VRSAVSDVSWSSGQAGSTAVGGRPSVHGGRAAAESSDQRRVIIKRGRRWRCRRRRRGGSGKYKKDVRSCGVWHVFFLHSLIVVRNGFLQFARVYYGDGSDSYLILDIPTVPHSRLNEPLSTRTVKHVNHICGEKKIVHTNITISENKYIKYLHDILYNIYQTLQTMYILNKAVLSVQYV